MAGDTREKILEAARATVQERGYGGLSFRDLARDVGVKSASIHYHFATKGELGAAVAGRYTADFARYLDDLLAQGLDTATCLHRYTAFFAETLRGSHRMCLAGILAAERNELPDAVRREVVRFADMNEDWLARVLARRGARDPEAVRRHARGIYAAVSGAQLAAHSRGDASVFADIVDIYRETGLLP